MDCLTMPVLYGCTVMLLSGPYRVLQEGRKKMEKGPRGGLYVLTLWGGGGGIGAHPEGVPRDGEPQEKELCADPPPLSAMPTDQVEVAMFFREVFDWDHP
jgi:hypothetical protein